MSKHLQRIRHRDEEGFTLVELLVVIVILGILAAVVVFAVGGINNKGEESACKIDTRTIATAEEAAFANGSIYVEEPALKSRGFLSTESTLHDVTLTGTPVGSSFQIKVSPFGATKKCGVSGGVVGTSPNI